MQRHLRRTVQQQKRVKEIDDSWSADLLEIIIFYGFEINRGFRFVLVFIDNLDKTVWAVLLKMETAIEVTDAFASMLKIVKKRRRQMETDDGREFVNKTSNVLVKLERSKRFSRFGS